MFASLKRSGVFLLGAALVMTASLLAQATPQLIRLKHFSALNGTVDFLPGAWVRVRRDSQTTFYELRGGRFLPADPPELIRQWQAFDWRSVDVLDQVAIQNYDPNLDQFLPRNKKVKNAVDIPVKAHNDELVLVCFTKKTTEQFSRPGDTDIYLAAVLRKTTDSHATYKSLWTRKLETDASYGDLTLQNIPKLGRFIVLYWASVGGSGGMDGLDIYRLRK